MKIEFVGGPACGLSTEDLRIDASNLLPLIHVPQRGGRTAAYALTEHEPEGNILPRPTYDYCPALDNDPSLTSPAD